MPQLIRSVITPSTMSASSLLSTMSASSLRMVYYVVYAAFYQGVTAQSLRVYAVQCTASRTKASRDSTGVLPRVCAHTHVFATCRTLYTVHCTACTTCRTLYTVQPALLVGHCTLYTVQPCRCYTLPLYSPVSQYTVHYKYTQYSALQVYAVQCTTSIRSTVHCKYTQYSVLQVYAVQCTASIRSTVHYKYTQYSALQVYAVVGNPLLALEHALL
jgi:hypothetical protein